MQFITNQILNNYKNWQNTKQILTSNAEIEGMSAPFIFILQGELLIIVNWLYPFPGKIGYAP